MENFLVSRFFSKRKLIRSFGPELIICDDANRDRVLFYVKQKAFKLKENITVFADKEKSKELLKINTQQIIDLWATFDVVDAETGEKYGSLKKKGWKFRDFWEILDAQGNKIGTVLEPSIGRVLLRGFLSTLIPQVFHVKIGETLVGEIKQHITSVSADFSMDTGELLDKKLRVGILVLLQLIEKRTSM